MKCEMCKTEFNTKSFKAKFCSDACRKKFQRTTIDGKPNAVLDAIFNTPEPELTPEPVEDNDLGFYVAPKAKAIKAKAIKAKADKGAKIKKMLETDNEPCQGFPNRQKLREALDKLTPDQKQRAVYMSQLWKTDMRETLQIMSEHDLDNKKG